MKSASRGIRPTEASRPLANDPRGSKVLRRLVGSARLPGGAVLSHWHLGRALAQSSGLAAVGDLQGRQHVRPLPVRHRTLPLGQDWPSLPHRPPKRHCPPSQGRDRQGLRHSPERDHRANDARATSEARRPCGCGGRRGDLRPGHHWQRRAHRPELRRSDGHSGRRNRLCAAAKGLAVAQAQEAHLHPTCVRRASSLPLP